MNRRTFLKRSFFLGTSLLVASYPFFIERYLVQINRYRIPVPNLPKEFTDFRILHLTDLHFGFLVPELLIQHVIEKANNINKDIVVCTGDYIHERKITDHIEQVWSLIAKLKAKSGVYSVLGNHDHGDNFDRSLYWIEKSGQNLRHRAKPIEHDGARIWIGGAGDLWKDEPGIDNAFHNVPDNDCKILLAHNPDTADTSFDARVDLMISGHTHGGQVNIPLYGPPVLPVRNKRYSSGYIKSEKTNLFISKGIGWAIIPVRFNCMPEIAILELQPA